jgi:hypothetical protein
MRLPRLFVWCSQSIAKLIFDELRVERRATVRHLNRMAVLDARPWQQSVQRGHTASRLRRPQLHKCGTNEEL